MYFTAECFENGSGAFEKRHLIENRVLQAPTFPKICCMAFKHIDNTEIKITNLSTTFPSHDPASG